MQVFWKEIQGFVGQRKNDGRFCGDFDEICKKKNMDLTYFLEKLGNFC